MACKYERLNVISDSRGYVFEPLLADAFSSQRNAHVVISEPGVVRGNHYHLKGEETITVVGPALVRFRNKDIIEDTQIPAGEAFRFTFPAGVSHAIQNLNEEPNVLVAFNTVEHDPKDPDTEEDILL